MILAGNYDMAVADTLSAQKKYDRALQIAHRTGFPEMFSLVYESMSDSYYHHKDYKKGSKLLPSAHKINLVLNYFRATFLRVLLLFFNQKNYPVTYNFTGFNRSVYTVPFIGRNFFIAFRFEL
ncbi:MAG: hypothetical protein QM763_05870 [Agriterribacter sp.]